MRRVFFPELHRIPIRHPLHLRPHSLCTITGGVLLTASALLVRILSNPSYQIYFMTRQFASLPPLWILMSVHWVFMFVMGAVIGKILADCRPYLFVAKYRVGMIFVLQMTLYLAVYPLLFHSQTPWIALLLLLLALILSILCIPQFYALCRPCALSASLFSCWLLYLLLLLLGCLLQI